MRFRPNLPIETREPTVTVDPGLAVGRHRFRLVVVDSAGLSSQPAEIIVTISRTSGPIPGPVPIPIPIPIPIPGRPTGPVNPS